MKDVFDYKLDEEIGGIDLVYEMYCVSKVFENILGMVV